MLASAVDGVPTEGPSTAAAAESHAGAALDAAPVEAPKKPGKDQQKGSRLAQDVHEDTVKASAEVLAEVTGTLLTAAPAASGIVMRSSSATNGQICSRMHAVVDANFLTSRLYPLQKP